MKLSFQKAEFFFKDDSGNNLKAIYSPTLPPPGKKPGKYNLIKLYKNDVEIGVLTDDSTVSRANASVFLNWAIHKAI